jgi:enamine deaminase RidA (YjgF/YER057c/UK114 family)
MPAKAIKGGGFVYLAGTTPQDPATGKMVRGDAARG